MRRRRVASPVGTLALAADDGALVELHFVDDGAPADAAPVHHADPTAGGDPRVATAGDVVDDDVLDAAEHQLAEYFAGARESFDVPLRPRGSDFQLRVWAALREIPYGTTTSYGAVAARLGLPPGASRAVGLANGANPIAVIVPCHRVVGADGGLTGFGGGIERKEVLLALEGSALF